MKEMNYSEANMEKTDWRSRITNRRLGKGFLKNTKREEERCETERCREIEIERDRERE